MAIASAWYSVDSDARCVPGAGLEAFGAAYAGPSTLVRPVSGDRPSRSDGRGTTVGPGGSDGPVTLLVTGPRSSDVRPSLSRAAPPTDVPGAVHQPPADRSRRRPRSSAAVRRAGNPAARGGCL